MDLRTLARKAVEDYLGSVLIVDEEWELSGPREPTAPLVKPGLRSRSAAPETGTGQANFQDTGAIDVVALTMAFTKAGMHLAPVRPETKPKHVLKKAIRDVAFRSDVVVLDWNIHGDNGERCLHLSKELVDTDGSRRFRVLVIYTGQPLGEVESALQKALRLPVFIAGKSSRDHLHVMVLAKPGRKTIDAKDSRLAAVEDVPTRVLEFVAEETHGILPVVALSALAAIRDYSQRLLGQLDASLDPGYLGHRSLLPDPEDAADQLPELIADEIRAILEDARIADQGRLDVVSLWLAEEAANYGSYVDDYGLSDSKDGVGWMLAFHERGFHDKASSRWKDHPKPSEAFKKALIAGPALVHNPQGASGIDEAWAHQITMRSDYLGKPATLRLGSMLVKEQNAGTGKYLLCLMPHCDSVRIRQIVSFAFLVLDRVEDGRFGLVVRHRGEWVRLSVPKDLSAIETMDFKPKDGFVMATEDPTTESRVFRSQARDRVQWLGELRHDIAHSIVQELGSHASRIGLSGSEWLRLNSRG